MNRKTTLRQLLGTLMEAYTLIMKENEGERLASFERLMVEFFSAQFKSTHQHRHSSGHLAVRLEGWEYSSVEKVTHIWLSKFEMDNLITAISRLKNDIEKGNLPGYSHYSQVKTITDHCRNEKIVYNKYVIAKKYATILKNGGSEASQTHCYLTDITTEVHDFFSCEWKTFSEYFSSLLVTYYIEYGSFEKVSVCKNCKRIFCPERHGDNRGIFCCEDCRKEYFNVESKIFTNCQSRQRMMLSRAIERLIANKYEVNSQEIFYVPIEKCRECTDIMQVNVKGGDCPNLTKRQKSIVFLYREKKKEKKLKRIGR